MWYNKTPYEVGFSSRQIVILKRIIHGDLAPIGPAHAAAEEQVAEPHAKNLRLKVKKRCRLHGGLSIGLPKVDHGSRRPTGNTAVGRKSLSKCELRFGLS